MAVIPNGAVIGTLAVSVSNAMAAISAASPFATNGKARASRTKLLVAVEHWLLAAGCTQLSLHVTAVLHRAIRFYEKNGFMRTGRSEDFFGMPLAEFSKPLK